ncbi:MAG: transglutaminaseTgpA domain-containing protein, partial [Actinomycetes bacterium]
MAQVGRRVGATALGIALVVPAVLPQIDASALGFGSGGFGPGSGGRNTVAVLNPILDLGRDLRREDDRLVIRYEGKPTYLRVVGLDEFGGDSWRPSRLQVSTSRNDVEDGLREPPGLTDDAVGTTNALHRIQVFGLDQQWLPLPYPARRVQNIEGRWVYDPATFNVFSTNTSTRDLTYEVRSLEVNPTAEQLRAAGPPPDDLNPFLELPLNLSPRIGDAAQRVTGDAPTAYDQALALQDWLRDPDEFTYSTKVADELGDDNGSQAIAAFLRTRRGYCVQFSSTMAVMARQLGIPARVAVGFTAGTSQLGTRLVSLHDAHAWPELYFEGIGWV